MALKIALIGYGRMGKVLEEAVQARGHQIVTRIDPLHPAADDSKISRESLHGADVALEFTHPRAAQDNCLHLLDLGVNVVSGSTGWEEGVPEVRRAAERNGTGFLWAPNFALGVQVLFRIVAQASGLLGQLGFSPFLIEEHHQGKQDAPSGTARRLAELVVAGTPGKERFGPAPASGPIPPELVPVAWIRAGLIPGNHTIGWDGAGETIEVHHRARDRSVFAAGAVRAAEWLVEHPGPHTLEEMMDDLFQTAGLH